MSSIKTRSGSTVVLPDEAEDRRIQAGIDADPDNPELDAHFFERARPAAEVLGAPAVAALVARRGRGRPAGSVAEHSKKLVSLRLDPEVLEAARNTGPGWQTRVNEVLRREFLLSS